MTLFCNSLTNYSRFETRVVKVGEVEIGGKNPIRIQSMTTADTMDTKATVAESIRLIEAGSELVRITAPSKKEAENLAEIKKQIRAAGFETPLVADIHFTPNAAEIAAKIVEKVRVNPGNYADKKRFQNIEYTDETYQKELERIQAKFTPLVKICKEYGTAMRIGTNHGSLSDRIMSRYGDTPLGMVESAMEFLRIAEDLNYYNLVLSMKSSNTQVMVQAYRLLVKTMKETNMNYPLHLGVTEAGDGEDGRIKSALGIGTLLEDGLGDTIRVSLTEDPEHELPVCKDLVNRYKNRKANPEIPAIHHPEKLNFYHYQKRKTIQVFNTGGEEIPRVVADLSQIKNLKKGDLKPVGYHFLKELDKWGVSDMACDFVYLGKNIADFNFPIQTKIIYDFETWQTLENKTRAYPFIQKEDYLKQEGQISEMNFLGIQLKDLDKKLKAKIKNDKKAILIISTENEHAMAELRRIFVELETSEIQNPVIIQRIYKNISIEKLQLYAATDLGALFINGFGDGIFLSLKEHEHTSTQTHEHINNIAFGILQAARVRISKTEYIACPSCGRTLFDLQETTAKIRARTSHLKGVKIGIMGCIVNGPGEMADADFGYVGSGVGKITLYKGQEVVKRNIPSENALDELIDLIKENDMWVEA